VEVGCKNLRGGEHNEDEEKEEEEEERGEEEDEEEQEEEEDEGEEVEVVLELPVVRLLLVNKSKYFAALFSTRFREGP